jgi:flagellar assembly factor FliW
MNHARQTLSRAAAADTVVGPEPSVSTARLHIRSHLVDVEVEPCDVVTFPDGLPGFEGSRQFVLLELDETAPLKVLHAVNADDPSFLVVDPRNVLPNFRCDIGSADRARLGASDDGTFLWLAIVSVSGEDDVTVNLRAPIVIDPTRMRGRQVLPNACVYPLQHPIERLT